MLPRAATPSRSRSAPVVGRLTGDVPVLTVVVVVPGPVPGGVFGVQLVVQPCGGVQSCWHGGGVQSCWHGGGVQSCWHGGGVQSCWHGGGVQSCWHGGGVQSCWHGGGVQSCWHGVLQSLPMHEVEPPLQLALAKPPAAAALPHTFTGALIGAVTVLPEPTEMLRFPVTLPLWLWSPTPEMVELDPPSQPALEKPATASEIPHRLIGALIGAVIVLPDRTEMLP